MWGEYIAWHRMECFLWALCVFTEAFLFSTQVMIFVVKNTPSLGSFPLRRLIFSMIILCLSSESMWVSNDGISQNICSVWQHIYLCLCKESSMFGNLTRIFCRVVNSLLINMKISVSKWLVVNEIYNRSFVVTQVRLLFIRRPHGKDVGTFQIFYFHFTVFLLYLYRSSWFSSCFRGK